MIPLAKKTSNIRLVSQGGFKYWITKKCNEVNLDSLWIGLIKFGTSNAFKQSSKFNLTETLLLLEDTKCNTIQTQVN